MNAISRIGAVAMLAALLPAGAHAQAGRADLRYVAPMPSVLTVTSIDSMSNSITGLPSGDMSMQGTIRAVSELRFTPADIGFKVTGMLKEIGGSMETPMGSMPVTATTDKAVEFRINETGPGADDLADMMPAPGSATQEDILGSSRAVAGLIVVPGRVLSIGETWTDTMRVTPEMDGINTDMTVITNGTYASDTVIDGRTLNVLRTTTQTLSKMSGTVQGMAMTQDMNITARGTVLWDSALHVPVHQDLVSETKSDMTLLQAGMTMTTTVQSRSITTAHAQE